ncbi:hypothetical protein ACFY7Y_29815 [Streptomyces virginiae]|uniref:hypothetical protein n=1 Tax=Streptomyces virginiae TaxID=1961 RepID=UPI0036C779C5
MAEAPDTIGRIVDFQSVMGAPPVMAATSGYDGVNKINGCELHVVVDLLGLLLGLAPVPPSRSARMCMSCSQSGAAAATVEPALPAAPAGPRAFPATCAAP